MIRELFKVLIVENVSGPKTNFTEILVKILILSSSYTIVTFVWILHLNEIKIILKINEIFITICPVSILCNVYGFI